MNCMGIPITVHVGFLPYKALCGSHWHDEKVFK